MAITMRGLCKLNIALANNIYSKNIFINGGVRFLYSEKSLGINSYEDVRAIYRKQFSAIQKIFRNKMTEVCENSGSVIFTEDLKAILHVAEKDPQDMHLVEQMFRKYNTVAVENRVGTYSFGPVIMRMYYFLQEPQIALKAFRSPELQGLFQHKSSVQILACLLYKFEMYTEIREIYEEISKDAIMAPKRKFVLCILLAACYQQNTPESFQYAMSCWSELSGKEELTLRAYSLISALALNQGAPELALEMISRVRRVNFVDIRCLKIIAYSQLKKYYKIIPLFNMSLGSASEGRLQTYFSDVIDNLEAQIMFDKPDQFNIILQQISQLKETGFVVKDVTLKEHLLKPIEFERQVDKFQQLSYSQRLLPSSSEQEQIKRAEYSGYQ